MGELSRKSLKRTPQAEYKEIQDEIRGQTLRRGQPVDFEKRLTGISWRIRRTDF